MEKTGPILYGVADCAEIRKVNAWFVDRTAKIRDLETARYAVVLRPRRFGKSLQTSILEAYYDVHSADRFDEFFAGTDIGALGITRPTTRTTGVSPVANGQDACSPSSSVTINRFVLVFHGSDCVLSEEV